MSALPEDEGKSDWKPKDCLFAEAVLSMRKCLKRMWEPDRASELAGLRGQRGKRKRKPHAVCGMRFVNPVFGAILLAKALVRVDQNWRRDGANKTFQRGLRRLRFVCVSWTQLEER